MIYTIIKFPIFLGVKDDRSECICNGWGDGCNNTLS